MNQQAFVKGFMDTLEKYAKKLRWGGMGQVYPGRQHQGLNKRVKGIQKMKKQQRRQAMKGAKYSR